MDSGPDGNGDVTFSERFDAVQVPPEISVAPARVVSVGIDPSIYSRMQLHKAVEAKQADKSSVIRVP